MSVGYVFNQVPTRFTYFRKQSLVDWLKFIDDWVNRSLPKLFSQVFLQQLFKTSLLSTAGFGSASDYSPA